MARRGHLPPAVLCPHLQTLATPGRGGQGSRRPGSSRAAGAWPVWWASPRELGGPGLQREVGLRGWCRWALFLHSPPRRGRDRAGPDLIPVFQDSWIASCLLRMWGPPAPPAAPRLVPSASVGVGAAGAEGDSGGPCRSGRSVWGRPSHSGLSVPNLCGWTTCPCSFPSAYALPSTMSQGPCWVLLPEVGCSRLRIGVCSSCAGL